MSEDISPMLDGWDYEPGQLKVRKIEGRDRLPKLQIRMDLGIMQLAWSGRPDGTRPHDSDSLLEYQAAQLHHHESSGAEEPFTLSREECWALSQEAMQYYWRRVGFFELKEYERAEDDAVHNLHILDLCENHAENDEDRQIGEQYRVFVTSHRIQAHALRLVEGEEHTEAVAVIRRGITEIEEILKEQGEVDYAEECVELQFLREWEKEVEGMRELSPREQLQADLNVAVEKEQFELAASLRDQLRQMGTTPDLPGLPPRRGT